MEKSRRRLAPPEFPPPACPPCDRPVTVPACTTRRISLGFLPPPDGSPRCRVLAGRRFPCLGCRGAPAVASRNGPSLPPLFLVAGSTDNSPASDRDDDPQLTGRAVDVFDAVARPNHIRYPHVLQPGSETAGRFLAGSVTSIFFSVRPIRTVALHPRGSARLRRRRTHPRPRVHRVGVGAPKPLATASRPLGRKTCRQQ